MASRPTLAPDTALLIDPDTAFVDTLSVDTLRADTVAAAAADTVQAAPDFGAFWSDFQAAVGIGTLEAIAPYAHIGDDGDLDAATLDAFEEPFRDALLRLTVRDVRRNEAARDVRVVVGYDAQGRVVPEDEADRDEAIRLRFAVVDGAYRWMSLETDA